MMGRLRKVYWVIAIASVLFLLLLVSCVPFGPKYTTEDGYNALNSGDVEKAGEAFQDVLNHDPDNPEANAGMAVVEIYKLYKDYHQDLQNLGDFKTLTRSLSPETLRTSLIRGIFAFSERGVRGFTRDEGEGDLDTFLSKAEDAQRRLKKVEQHLEKAIEGDFSYKLYLNRFDWDCDGKLEPTQPLVLREIEDPSKVYKAIDILTGKVTPEGTLVVDPEGGDAWFDFETLLEGKDVSVVFDDNDYVIRHDRPGWSRKKCGNDRQGCDNQGNTESCKFRTHIYSPFPISCPQAGIQ